MATSYVDMSARLMLDIKNILELNSERNISYSIKGDVPRASCTVVLGRLLHAIYFSVFVDEIMP